MANPTKIRNSVSQILREIEFANFRVMKNVEWLYFCVLNFSRNAKGFDPFFANFRENCERTKVLQFAYLYDVVHIITDVLFSQKVVIFYKTQDP